MTRTTRPAGALLGLLLTLLLTLRPGAARAQNYLNQHYLFSPANGISLASGIQPRPGGYILTGERAVTLGGRRDLVVSLLDTTGTVTRQRVYHNDSASYGGRFAGSLLVLPSGGYVLPVIQAKSAARYSAMLWWLDAQGDTLRTTTYSTGPYHLIPNHLCRLASGGFVIVGTIGQTPTAQSFGDWFAIGTDAQGRERWRHTWRLLGDGAAFNALATPDGGALLTGLARPQLLSTDYYYRNHMAAVKLDSTGATEWQRVYADSTGGYAPVVVPGGYLIGGAYLYRRTPVRVLERTSLYRLDSLGNLVSRRDYGPQMDVASPQRLHRLADGSLVLAGISSDSTAYPTTGYYADTGFALKLCPNGDSVWYRTYRYYTNPLCNNYLWDMKPTPDGGFVGAGFLHARAAGGQAAEAWVIKTDADGYVTAGGPPSAVVCQPVGLAPESAEATAVQVWPNPSADGRFTVGGAGGGAVLMVSDALGRRVWAGAAAGAETRVDLSRCAPGLYLLRVTGRDGRTVSKKLLR